jgi:hypothetical protein
LFLALNRDGYQPSSSIPQGFTERDSDENQLA